MSWVLTFAGFSLLIIAHEAGHFAAAKAVGMRVERFALFFPPLIARRRRGETEYGIGAIPLGGYVKITGMSPREDLSPEVAPRAYFRQPVWKRLVVIAAGPAVNLVIAFLILGGIFLANGEVIAVPVVDSVAHGAPASGRLAPGDRVVAVDGRRGDATALSQQINRHACPGRQVNGCVSATPVLITVERARRELTVAVSPRYDTSTDPPRHRVGFAYRTGIRPTDVSGSAALAVSTMASLTGQEASAIARVFYSERGRRQVGTVVGAYETTREAFSYSATVALFLLGSISLLLAVVNLFPFLPLDGGHIFWALAEKLRGRAIPFVVMERASVIGIVLVAFLFITGLSNDIGRLQGSGFGVR